MKSKLKQLTALVCAAAMMAALCLALRPVDTAYGASLNDQLAETRAKKQEIQQQLDKIKSDKAKALEQKELLDQQAAIIAQQIDLLEVQIQDTQDRITQNQAEEEKQYDLFCHQVRQEEERGTVSYWSVLFKATGFADLLSRMDFINEIVEHDQSVIDQLRTLRQQLAQDKADLEQHQAELTASKTELDAQVAEATRVFEEYAASEAGQQALLNQQAAREKELQEEILADYGKGTYLAPFNEENGVPLLKQQNGDSYQPIFTDMLEFNKFNRENFFKASVMTADKITGALAKGARGVVVNPMGVNLQLPITKRAASGPAKPLDPAKLAEAAVAEALREPEKPEVPLGDLGNSGE